MNLAGQGATSALGRRGGLDDGGYLMVVLLVGMAVTAVWMGTLLPSWRQQATREKEAELIFRGEQYARAIALYYRKNNQTLPPNIDTLVSQRYLRKKYLDPITGEEFLTVGGVFGGSGQGQPARGGAAQPQRGAAAGAAPQRGGPTPQGSGQAPQGQQAASGGQAAITGVRSTSNDASIAVYRNQTTYSQFPFDFTVALQKMGASAATGTGSQRADPARGRGRGDEGAPIGRGGPGGGVTSSPRGPAPGGEQGPANGPRGGQTGPARGR